ncbi:MAG: hypothetical protein MK105_03805 [Crocinitomicaceae bacterium]|nr:hypothetical protein [Crocinitomicaceae bacterium]
MKKTLSIITILITTTSFSQGVHQEAEQIHTLCNGNPIIQSPTWGSLPNKIYSYCPQVFVGVGTSNPLHALHVHGRGYFSQHLGIGSEPNVNTQVIAQTNKEVGICIDYNYSQSYGYAYKAIVKSPTTKGIGIYNEQFGKDVFTVYADGKIEVSNQTGKIWQLESNGLMRGREIKLDLDIWADYVFAPDYQLMPLSELENYVQKEKHLPNVPSESDIIQDGVDLGKMNVILLEKVEELTLYLIDQNKSNEKLKAEIELLKKRISELESNNK